MRFGSARPAWLLAGLLAACGSEAPVPAPTSVAQQGPESPAGVALSGARVQLPVIAGRPGVAYFTVTQTGAEPRTIAGVHVQGAGRAEMHATTTEAGTTRMAAVPSVPIGGGKTVRFEPGGYHVMLFELAPSLAAGGSTEITVTFDNGDKVSTSAPIIAAGAAQPDAMEPPR